MSDLTLEDVRRALTYNPETGELRWTEEGRKRRRSDVPGTLINGYPMIRIAGRLQSAHRLAWLLHYGKWPTHEIDHINGDRADNRIANLRDVPHAANSRNHPARRLLVGAVQADNGKWRAMIHRYGVVEDLGEEFDTREQANAAWLKAKRHWRNPDTRRPQLRIP